MPLKHSKPQGPARSPGVNIEASPRVPAPTRVPYEMHEGLQTLLRISISKLKCTTKRACKHCRDSLLHLFYFDEASPRVPAPPRVPALVLVGTARLRHLDASADAIPDRSQRWSRHLPSANLWPPI